MMYGSDTRGYIKYEQHSWEYNGWRDLFYASLGKIHIKHY
jgi:hypothetical protein